MNHYTDEDIQYMKETGTKLLDMAKAAELVPSLLQQMAGSMHTEIMAAEWEMESRLALRETTSLMADIHKANLEADK